MASRTLPTLAEWAKQRIPAAFEAKDEASMQRAMEEAFAPHLRITVNGQSMGRKGLTRLAQAMRRSSPDGLKAEWQDPLVVVPADASHRNGWIGGVYIIRGARKELSGHKGVLNLEQHKCVNVIIESLSDDPNTDSRRIVSISSTVANVRAKL